MGKDEPVHINTKETSKAYTRTSVTHLCLHIAFLCQQLIVFYKVTVQDSRVVARILQFLQQTNSLHSLAPRQGNFLCNCPTATNIGL
jgi:hypothetical protein